MNDIKALHKGYTKTTKIIPVRFPATDLSDLKKIISDILDTKLCCRILIDINKGIIYETSVMEPKREDTR